MERMPTDIIETEKEGSTDAKRAMNNFFTLASEQGVEVPLIVGNFNFNMTATYVSMYEQGYGMKNVPDQEKHIIDKKTLRPIGTGHGWYLKHIKDVNINDMIDMTHFMTNMSPNETLNVYVIFTERRSRNVRPCEPPHPMYIGFCKNIF